MAIRLQHPLPGADLTAAFGWRPAFTENGIRIPAMLHDGADMGAPEGTPILAAHGGRVTFVGWWNDNAGWTVRIGSAFGSTVYCHQSGRSPLVNPGDEVRAGQPIGYVGQSGMATGAHLHWMLETGQGWIDPMPYLTSSLPPKPSKQKERDDDMAKNSGFVYPLDKDPKTIVQMIANTDSGFVSEYGNGPGKGGMGGSYNNPVAAAFGTGSYAPITESHAREIKRACAEVRAAKS